MRDYVPTFFAFLPLFMHPWKKVSSTSSSAMYQLKGHLTPRREKNHGGTTRQESEWGRERKKNSSVIRQSVLWRAQLGLRGRRLSLDSTRLGTREASRHTVKSRVDPTRSGPSSRLGEARPDSLLQQVRWCCFTSKSTALLSSVPSFIPASFKVSALCSRLERVNIWSSFLSCRSRSSEEEQDVFKRKKVVKGAIWGGFVNPQLRWAI